MKRKGGKKRREEGGGAEVRMFLARLSDCTESILSWCYRCSPLLLSLWFSHSPLTRLQDQRLIQEGHLMRVNATDFQALG